MVPVQGELSSDVARARLSASFTISTSMVLRPSRRKTRLGESGAKPRISKLGLARNNLLRLHRLADPRIVITTSACLADKAAVARSNSKTISIRGTRATGCLASRPRIAREMVHLEQMQMAGSPSFPCRAGFDARRRPC